MKKILFIIIAFITSILVIVVFFMLNFSQQQNNLDQNLLLPTPLPTQTISKRKPPVLYNQEKTNLLVERAQDRIQLSSNGTLVKERLIKKLNGESGDIYTSPKIRIEYIQAPDLFQAEILSTEITSAKEEAVNWMLSQGFTSEDLCNLPFSFYLSIQAKNSIKSNEVFNPLPEGC